MRIFSHNPNNQGYVSFLPKIIYEESCGHPKTR